MRAGLCPFCGSAGLSGKLHALQRRHFAAQGVQFEFFGQGRAMGRVDGAHLKVAQFKAGADIQRQSGQPAPGEHVVQMVAQFVLKFGGQQGEMVADILKGWAYLKNLGGGFGADAGHAGDVVAGVAHKGLHIGPLGGGQTAFFRKLVGSKQFFFLESWVPHENIGAKALLEVLVAADNDHGALF